MTNIRLLTKDEIEVKVKSVSDRGILLLLYKTARTDMDVLDEIFGPENWQSDYKEIKGNLYAGIGVRDVNGVWVWKWDCGIESRSDGDGNEKKGEASDAFKRAGFKWGIGRELYTSPFIWVSSDVVELCQRGGKYYMKNPFERFYVSHIEYNDSREITKLTISGRGAREIWSNVKTKNQSTKTTETTKLYPSPDEFRDMLSFCNTLDEIRDLLNGQRDNPAVRDLVALATARKNELTTSADANTDTNTGTKPEAGPVDNATAMQQFIDENMGK